MKVLVRAAYWFTAAATVAHLGLGCASSHSRGLTPLRAPAIVRPIHALPAQVTEAELDEWMSQSAFHSEKADLTAGRRELLCVQVMPFSGLPGIYALVYRRHKGSLSLLFSALVSKPPHFERGQSLTFSYDRATDSVVVASAGVECLRILMEWLYPWAP